MPTVVQAGGHHPGLQFAVEINSSVDRTTMQDHPEFLKTIFDSENIFEAPHGTTFLNTNFEQIAHAQRGAADCGEYREYRQAAGAVAQAVNQRTML